MSCNSCCYDCSSISEASPICPNPDVSGIGVRHHSNSNLCALIETQVVVGYTVNAGIVVLIIVLNYLFAFQPEADPFLHDQPDAQPRQYFKPNPIDKLYIKFIRGMCKISYKPSARVEEALVKVN